MMPPMKNVRLGALKHWLREHGAEVSAIDFEFMNGDRGSGIVANSGIRQKFARNVADRVIGWFNPFRTRTVAAIPAKLVINGHSVQQDTVFGDILARHIRVGNITERDAVFLWLIVHRSLGARSPFHDYIATLPAQFNTPLFYSPEQMRELRGTSLERGVAVAKARSARGWEGVQPVLQEMQSKLMLTVGASNLGLPQHTVNDWTWAFSVYWSRCLALPAQGTQGSAASGQTVESLVPGLDMANHRSNTACRWEVSGSLESADTVVRLVADKRGGPRPGDELCIQYGDSNNESFLFLHGFAEEGSVADRVLLSCPLGPEDEWDPVMQARVQLLKDNGLTPQFTLDATAGSKRRAALPAQGRRVLEVLVMTPADLAACLEADGDSKPALARSTQEGLGLDMAVYTAFCKLLELKLYEQEGPEGTGPLEDDVRRIEAGRGDMQQEQWSCLLYRAGQKRVTREYLREAHRDLQEVMQKLQAFVDRKLEKEGRGTSVSSAAASV